MMLLKIDPRMLNRLAFSNLFVIADTRAKTIGGFKPHQAAVPKTPLAAITMAQGIAVPS